MPKGLLFVVSRDALDQYEHLKRVFAHDKRVRVILDRRSGERRKAPGARGVERRRADRRSRPALEERLRAQGWAMVRVEGGVAPQDQIDLPSVPEAPVEPVPSQAPVAPVRSILVVDDDPRLAGLLEDILRSDGHRVTTAGNGVEALRHLADQAFDLLLLDIRMPELDGPALYRELERRNPEHARRVMFMTGGAVEAETADLLATVRMPVLRKPLEVQEFRAMVQRFFLAADSFRRRS